ncbi:unnamed protein product [Moneuplotes crassus]|uniref:Uncharacterized protein n=1 Tax=Euplotes crassus TaxID=5936 RepID=A0AAD1UPC5_EUPCR|nr:unnamed protein product [Moneuplotes crassus]
MSNYPKTQEEDFYYTMRNIEIKLKMEEISILKKASYKKFYENLFDSNHERFPNKPKQSLYKRNLQISKNLGEIYPLKKNRPPSLKFKKRNNKRAKFVGLPKINNRQNSKPLGRHITRTSSSHDSFETVTSEESSFHSIDPTKIKRRNAKIAIEPFHTRNEDENEYYKTESPENRQTSILNSSLQRNNTKKINLKSGFHKSNFKKLPTVRENNKETQTAPVKILTLHSNTESNQSFLPQNSVRSKIYKDSVAKINSMEKSTFSKGNSPGISKALRRMRSKKINPSTSLRLQVLQSRNTIRSSSSNGKIGIQPQISSVNSEGTWKPQGSVVVENLTQPLSTRGKGECDSPSPISEYLFVGNKTKSRRMNTKINHKKSFQLLDERTQITPKTTPHYLL